MHEKQTASASASPDSTAVRVALWRALHLLVDAPPFVFEDNVGLQLVAPDGGWRDRPDMHPEGTRGYRASIVGRARFVEDLVAAAADAGIGQYVVLGAGLDTFAQRKPSLAARLRIYEVDQPATQAWKRRRLAELGLSVPQALRFVPVDFEAGQSWLAELAAAGFDASQPAVVASTGVSMYLTKEAIADMLRHAATLAPGSTFAMTFLLPLELIPDDERAGHAAVYERARSAGTPFVSFFSPEEMLALSREAGFAKAEHVSTADLTHRYFAGRADGLRPSSGEAFLVATT
ncbi:class I SAM-dependent methyltransferase [Trinickia caryophylli]|uniref:S-adenosyl-L-methionine-dependent methyltransferase n=3 Tax=Trinickia caryophylli TaxID=28094 RepID=A0A1X7FNK1_TRICW|nr:class I SAM-dependent methyltransferase [Trinickia caryophylli]PMS13893.1 SAM-dependent methyltransferase [Trinickia caryophylli]TRX14388.1 class I SAM-dependent methyltransferase [Trinickia caryophylli]WQE14226.1 class I SAM-dependent methyltransferase [Trinickia caryophylli]SMF55751.1 transcriptional regulator, MerR family [Trinickia caryophylli]GLU33266.1 S-adenosyl-L-methionine-dependent methyltransferase [Trinickia caryophylli]